MSYRRGIRQTRRTGARCTVKITEERRPDGTVLRWAHPENAAEAEHLEKLERAKQWARAGLWRLVFDSK